MQAEAATDKGGGQSVARKPDVGNRRVQDPHAPPAIAGRRIASRHHARWCRLASANYFPTKRAFESRPPMHGGAVTITCCCSECQRVGAMPPKPETLLALSHSVERGESLGVLGGAALLGRSRQNLPLEMQGAANATALAHRTCVIAHATEPLRHPLDGLSDFLPIEPTEHRAQSDYCCSH